MKPKRLMPLLFIFIFLTPGAPAFSQAIGDPRLEPDPLVYSLKADFNPLDWRSLLELAYWASGDAGRKAAADTLDDAIDELSAAVSTMEARERGEAVLAFMHGRFLRSYRLNQSSLDTLLKTGRYNCLSSAVLYAVLGTAVGLEVSGVNTVDHAFCAVRVGGEMIDVETTTPYGFDPGTKTEFSDGFGRTTGFAYVPPGNYRSRTSIDLTGLFSLLLQNRIAAAESEGRYEDAVGLAVDRWELLGGKPGTEFEDIIIRMLNYGTKLSRAGSEEEALAWAERGIDAYGPHEKWDNFIDGVVNNLLIRHLRRGNPDDARERLDALKPRLTAETSTELELMVSDSELIAALDAVKSGGEDSDFLAVLEEKRTDAVIAATRLREVEVVWRLYKINALSKTDGWAAAWEETGKAISELGSGPQLEKALRVYRANHRAELYNEAAEAYNSLRLEEARVLAENALLEFPGETIFRNLLRNIERARSGN